MAKAKIRHIALATNDPIKTANFYKEAFGFQEVGRTGDPHSRRASPGACSCRTARSTWRC